MKKKICILASWYPTDSSPVTGIFIQEQAAVLSRKYDVKVMIPRLVGWRKLLRGKLGPGSAWQKQAGLSSRDERVVAPLPFFPVLLYRRCLSQFERSFVELTRLWGKPDLIHAHVVLPGGWLAVQLGRRHDIPVVLTEHSGHFPVYLKRKFHRNLVLDTIRGADRVIAGSPALADTIQSLHNTLKCDVIGALVRTDLFLPTSANGKPADGNRNTKTGFLCIALLNKNKGINYLLDAVNILIKRGVSGFQVILGGDGPELNRLKEQAKTLNIAGYCSFTGLLTRDAVRDQMQRCDVFVMPSLGETFGIVLGEAMACGKPVIATRCGGPEFVVTPETGTLVETADPDALADAMQEHITGQAEYDPCVVRQSVTRRFGEDAFVNNVSALYDQVWCEN